MGHLLQGRLIIRRDILVGVDGDDMALLLGDVANAVQCLVLVVLLRVDASIPATATVKVSVNGG